MSNEEHIEELLHKAHRLNKGKEVIDKAATLIKMGVDRYQAFSAAYFEIVKKDEIYRERHKGQGEVGENDNKGS